MKATGPWKLAQALARILTTCLFDLKVYGHKNVPASGAVLIVCNHQSNLDPVLIGARVGRPLSYMGKSELFVNPNLARFLRWLHGFPVHQGVVDIHALREAIARLRRGEALTVFPEGARTPDGKLQVVQRGVGLIAHRTKALVLPVVLDGSFKAWPLHKSMPRPGKIRVLYGRPADLSALSEEQIVEWIERKLRQMFQTLQEMESREP